MDSKIGDVVTHAPERMRRDLLSEINWFACASRKHWGRLVKPDGPPICYLVSGPRDVPMTPFFRKTRPAFSPEPASDTLGFYGVKAAPLDPTTLRDLAGGLVDRVFVFLPLGPTFKGPAFKISTGVVRGLDHREEIGDRIRTLRDGPDADYDASRDFYLKRRQAEINQVRGKRGLKIGPTRGIPQPSNLTTSDAPAPERNYRPNGRKLKSPCR